uniref:Uncharacterized protein n=1 Tax=Panagrolaimus davidi TaxID=227884 RepID=A0A914PL50_9BILA
MKLITLDRSKNVTYFGECKLQFNGIEKSLNFKMLDKVPVETITVTYSRIFVRRNNLLCCMNQNLQNVMILVFETIEKCENFYDDSTHPQSINTPVVNETKIFGDCFYFPLVKAIRSGIKDHRGLKTIIANFVKSLDDDDVNYYFNNFPEMILIHSPVSMELEENTGRKKKIVKPMHLIPES